MKSTMPLLACILSLGALGTACSAPPDGEATGQSESSALYHVPILLPATYTVAPGGAPVTVPVQVPAGWSNAPVTISITGLPVGVSATFGQACTGSDCSTLNGPIGLGAPAQGVGSGAPSIDQNASDSSPALSCGSGCGASFQLASGDGAGGIEQRASIVVSNGAQSYTTPIDVVVAPCVPSTCAPGQCGFVTNRCGGFIACSCRFRGQ